MILKVKIREVSGGRKRLGGERQQTQDRAAVVTTTPESGCHPAPVPFRWSAAEVVQEGHLGLCRRQVPESRLQLWDFLRQEGHSHSLPGTPTVVSNW